MNIRTRTLVRFTGLVALLTILASATSALAGGFYEKDGAAIRGYDPVAYFTDKKPVKGSPAYKADYGKSVFHFVSQSNRDRHGPKSSNRKRRP